MAITDWPTDERPREKLLNRGTSSLSDAELLAIFLRTGTRGKTAVDLARDLLQQFGGLRPLMLASKDNFCQAQGLGVAKYVQLQSVLEIGRRYLQENLSEGEGVSDSTATKAYLKVCLGKYSQEVFACLFLDPQYRIITCEELFFGTLSHAAVYPREVVKRCLHHHAAAVIFAHNHPAGNASPSQADQDITQTLKQALELIDIKVLDHIIIGANQVASFAELGMI